MPGNEQLQSLNVYFSIVYENSNYFNFDGCDLSWVVAVGTALSGRPRTDPSERDYRTGLLPRVVMGATLRISALLLRAGNEVESDCPVRMSATDNNLTA